jgi:tetratricopeptide (TPR) repeat protein
MARGIELFPDAADLLFLGGTLHERFASPQLQGLARSARLPDGMTFGIDSVRSELRSAEALFARTLAIDPGHVEARLRHGRVLGLLDRHAEARTELMRTLPDLVDPPLRYLAELFLGAEADALGDRDEAKAAYTRAAGLFPRAQSPRLALSLMAMHGGDRRASPAIRPVHDLPVEPDDRDDPWWAYHVVQTRETDLWLNRLYASLEAADRR